MSKNMFTHEQIEELIAALRKGFDFNNYIVSPQIRLDYEHKYIICFRFDKKVVEEIIKDVSDQYIIEKHSDIQKRFVFNDDALFRASAIALKLHFSQFNDRI